MRRMLLLAMIAAATTGLPALSAAQGDKLLLPRQGGNGANKDRLDARITTDPACRAIDPTDRDGKFNCLIGRRPPDPH